MDDISPLINPVDKEKEVDGKGAIGGNEEKDVDEILVAAGGFGSFQLILLIVCMIFNASVSYQTLSMYYAAADPPWQCTANATSDYCQHHMNQSIPESSTDFEKRCQIPRQEWEYTKPRKYSIVTEFNLVCTKEYLKALSTSSFFIGCAIGSLVSGPINDIYGRKLVVCLALLLMSVTSFTSSFITAVWQLILLRILMGCAFGAATIAVYVLLSECNASKHRGSIANVYFIGFTISQLILTGLAYWLRDWRLTLLYLSFLPCASFLMSLALYESPNWLLTKGRHAKAMEVLVKISKINRKPLVGVRLKLAAKNEMENDNNDERNYSYLHLFNNLKVFLLVIVQCILYMSIGLMFFGIALESSNLGGDLYFNFALSSLADIPGTVLVIFTSIYVGRKKTTSVTFIVSAVMLCAIGLVPERFNLARTALAILSRILLNVPITTLFLWSFEIFPTVLRSQGMNICQISSRAGSAVAPFITEICKNVSPGFPYFIMAGVGVISAVVGLVLPETINKPMRQQYEDMLPGGTTAYVEVTTNDLENEEHQ